MIEQKKEQISHPIAIPILDHTIALTKENAQQYLSIYHGHPTNTINKIRSNSIKKININGRAEIEKDNSILFIENYEKLASELKNSTVKLLQAGILYLSSNNSYRKETQRTIKNEVLFSLTEYMELRGLKDRKEARKQVESDLETIYNLSIGWKENSTKNELNFDMMRICYRTSIDHRGNILMSFSPEIATYLVNAYELKIPKLYWKLKDKYNPNSSPLLWKISMHKKQNNQRKNENIISVRILLQNAPYIPSYQQIKEEDRMYTRRIIEPLERDLYALENTLTWEYCNSKGTPLTDKQLSNFAYPIFSKCYIKFNWKNYPQLETKKNRKKVPRK